MSRRLHKVLFLIKKRVSYGVPRTVSYGLVNSCRFVVNALEEQGIHCKIAEVIDGNGIDREIHLYKPDLVIIEALFVTPEKLSELARLHPKVKWLVRIHSNTPFLSTEGIAFEWLLKYVKIPNVKIASNSSRLVKEFYQSLRIEVVFAPNIYQFTEGLAHGTHQHPHIVKIGCFGAIRPFKNHVEQALAAITFANSIDRRLEFYVNSSSGFETLGDPFLKNLNNIFKSTYHKLIVKEWQTHQDFLKLVQEMDLGMQVSFTETFNIVAADFVNNNIPIVGSHEIEWLSSLYQASPTDLEDIVNKLNFAWMGKTVGLQRINHFLLGRHNKMALNAWLGFLCN